jgi:2'-5' RNA ligase
MGKKLYFVAIEIPESFKSEIQDLKEELSIKFRAKHALKTPPHITLQMPIRIEEENEGRLIKNIELLNGKYPSGLIKLNDISSFPPRTIFIDVIAKGIVVELYEAVQKQINQLNFISDKITVSSFHPHITLMTRDLKKSMYKIAFESVGKMNFKQEIDIDVFHLYKHNGKMWEVLRTFDLHD